MLIQNNNDVKSLGFEGAKEFTIKKEYFSKVFKLLSTSTYKDVESSIIREIYHNGGDATKLSDHPDAPVIVKYKDGEISIKDEGIGMSKEFIFENYISLGESTKNQDASLVGGWGRLMPQ